VLRSMANRGIIHILNQTILFKQNKTSKQNKRYVSRHLWK